MSDHLSRAIPAYGNPNYRGVGDDLVLATNMSFESAQTGVVPYMSWTEIDADLFVENDADWVVDVPDVSAETDVVEILTVKPLVVKRSKKSG